MESAGNRMKKQEIDKVYDAIINHGDSFWNDCEKYKNWNGYLFADIIEYLKKEGYDLKLISL